MYLSYVWDSEEIIFYCEKKKKNLNKIRLCHTATFWIMLQFKVDVLHLSDPRLND